MRRTVLVAIFAALMPAPAMADITVFSPGIVNGPLRILAEQWTAQTGHKVTITGANVGRIRTAVLNDTPADLVLAPKDGFAEFAPKLSSMPVSVGRIPFGVVVKAGGRHPDISTEEKFIAFTREANALAFTDPALGSLSGQMVANMLARPQFSGAHPQPVRGMIGDAIVRGDAEFGGGALSEELMAKGAEVVGPFPASLGVFIDVSGAVLKISALPADAQSFLTYITRAEARPLWKAGGVETP